VKAARQADLARARAANKRAFRLLVKRFGLVLETEPTIPGDVEASLPVRDDDSSRLLAVWGNGDGDANGHVNAIVYGEAGSSHRSTSRGWHGLTLREIEARLTQQLGHGPAPLPTPTQPQESTMPLYVAEILNTNAVGGRCYAGSTRFYAHPDQRTNRGLVLVQTPNQETFGTETPALFETKEAAEEVAQTIRWSNQRYVIKPARGHARRDGKLVTVLRGTVRK